MKQVIRLPRPSEVQFFAQMMDYDCTYKVAASYKTKGPCFRVTVSAHQDDKKTSDSLHRAAYSQLLENIDAHLAVINPVDND